MNYGMCQRCCVDNNLSYCKQWDMWLCEDCEVVKAFEEDGLGEEDDL